MKILWTDEMLDRLKQHWLAGLSSTDSAVALSAEFDRELSRNAIIGKRHRHFMTDALLVEAAGVESAAVARVKERETARLEARKKRKDEKKSVKERASGRLRHRPSINIIELRTERGKQANAEARKQFFPTKNASQYITLMDLNHCNCHWPIDVPSGTMFCGQPALTGKPYCTVHWDRSIDKVRSVYVRKKDSRR